eukprot:gene12487-15698_t
MLQQRSLSPEHEGPNILPDMKAKYRWLLTLRKGSFIPPVAYQWSPESGCWELLVDQHAQHDAHEQHTHARGAQHTGSNGLKSLAVRSFY